MSNKSNKVKFGLKNCHYAKANFDEEGNVTYEKPVKIPGAVSLSLDPEGSVDPFYADDMVYYTSSTNAGYSGDLEIAMVPESFAKDILHEEEDANGVMAENADVEVEHFALLFEFSGDQRKIRHVMYNCTCSRPSVEGETIEDSKEPKTDSLELTATALVNGYVKAKTGTGTAQSVYDAWYDSVYLIGAESNDSGSSDSGSSDSGSSGTESGDSGSSDSGSVENPAEDTQDTETANG